MKTKKMIAVLVVTIAVLSAIAAVSGIFSDAGDGPFDYESIRGTTVKVYGTGIYGHMPADVAIQGIAQDWITLLVAIPLMVVSLIRFLNDNLRSRFVLTGTVGYFFVTYLFYLNMGMFNSLFLVYAALLALTFFALMNLLLTFDYSGIKSHLPKTTPAKWAGGFLMFNALAIAWMWLGIIVPPLLDGSIYPESLFHFTTLVVQGLDLGLLLPICFVSGYLLYQKTPMGLITGTVYIIFLSILMTALTAKIIAMAQSGVGVIPVIFIIPTINLITIGLTFRLIRSIRPASL